MITRGAPFKVRLMIFVSMCWLTFSSVLAASDYTFSWSTFFFVGVFPIAFVSVGYWTFAEKIRGTSSGREVGKDSGADDLKPSGAQANLLEIENSKLSKAAVKPGFSWQSNVLKWIAIAIGGAIGKVVGFSALLIPTLIFFLTSFILLRLNFSKDFGAARNAAISTMMGHTIWMLVGLLLTGSYEAVLLDIILMSLLIVSWLIARNGYYSFFAVLGVIFEILMSIVNLEKANSVSQNLAGAMILHLLLRTAVIVSLAFSLRAKRHEPTAGSSTEESA